MSWRQSAIRFFESDFGRGTFGVAIALVVCSPALFFGLPGATLVLGAIFGFVGGYAFARREWRKRGYVPKYDDIASPPHQ